MRMAPVNVNTEKVFVIAITSVFVREQDQPSLSSNFNRQQILRRRITSTLHNSLLYVGDMLLSI